jgi:hypothetical protein
MMINPDNYRDLRARLTSKVGQVPYYTFKNKQF